MTVAMCVRERNGVWHIAVGRGDGDWQPIACGEQDGSGIVAPGNQYPVEPTCPSCIKATA